MKLPKKEELKDLKQVQSCLWVVNIFLL